MPDMIVDVLGNAAVAAAVAEVNKFRDEAEGAAVVAVGAVAELTPYKTVPASDSALLRLLDAPQILPEIDLPARLGVYTLFRDDLTGGRVQLEFRAIDEDGEWGDPIIALSAASGPLTPAAITGDPEVPLVKHWTVDLKAPNGAALTKNNGADPVAQGEYVGSVPINFGNGELFLPTVFTPAQGEIYVERMQPSAVDKAVIGSIVEQAIKVERARPSGVFPSTVIDDRLTDWITGVVIEGREPGVRYGIWKWEKIGIRTRFYIKDWDRDVQVAQRTLLDGGGIDYATLTALKCEEGEAGGGGFTGITVTLTFDPTKAPAATGGLIEVPDYASGGFLPGNIRTIADQRAEFDRNAVAERIFFDPDDGFDGLDDAIRSTHRDQQTFGNNENFYASVRSVDSNSIHRIEVGALARQGTVMVEKMEGLLGGNPVVVGSITLPEWVDLRGDGLTLRTEDNARILEHNYSGAVRGIAFECDPPVVADPGVTNYARHSDAPNGRSRLPVVGDTRFQQQRQFQLVEDCSFAGGVNHRNWLDALAPQSGGYHRYERCRATRRNRATGQAAFGMHNGPAMSEPALIEHIATSVDHLRGPALQFLTSYVQDCGRSILRLDGCDPFLVQATCSMALSYAEMPDLWADRRAIEVVGYHVGPVSYEDPSCLGLMIPDNATWTGDFFDELGEPDEYGCLPKLVLDGTAVGLHSLAQRLNGKGNRTITVNGNSHVFNVSNPATSTATLIAQANANLGANVLQLVRMDRFEAANVGFERRVYAAPAGNTIAAGTALKRLGYDVVRVCAVDERPDGFALTPIVGGAAGTGGIMNSAPVVPGYYFPEVAGTEAAVNVPFGLDGNGRISFAAATKVGDVGGFNGGGGGIVRWWR